MVRRPIHLGIIEQFPSFVCIIVHSEDHQKDTSSNESVGFGASNVLHYLYGNAGMGYLTAGFLFALQSYEAPKRTCSEVVPAHRDTYG
jgi:hypothetical protein